MKTPKEFTTNLKRGIITKKMLELALFSVNKRAKNMRDKERDYRGYSRFNYYDKYHNKKLEYYAQKDIMLSLLDVICIHKEFIRYERERIYDYEKRYNKIVEKGDYVWANCFYDYEEDHEVYFVDIELKNKPIYFYYKFYELGEHSFHTPIDELEVEKYVKNHHLQIIEIDGLNTKGEDIHELVSPQFVKKLIALIESKEFIFKR